MPDDECNKDAQAPVEKFYSVCDVAWLLQFHVQTVRDDIRAGNLEVTRLGPRRTRVSEAQYRRYVVFLKDPANWK